ncbi:MAG: hypothetical protein V3T22_08740 [Planctomycetota bacterium]
MRSIRSCPVVVVASSLAGVMGLTASALALPAVLPHVSRAAALPAVVPGVSRAAVAASPAAPQGSALFKNPRFGYQFRSPKGWRNIALKTGEVWLTSKFLSEKSYFYTGDTGWTYEHQPEMLCIAFVHENMKRKKTVEEQEEDGVKTRVTTYSNPYKNYEDFLDRTYSGGGWYISKEEEGKHKGIPVTKYEIKVEKSARTGPKRIITWIFHAPDIDFALQTEVLETEYKGLKGLVVRSLKSFELIERSGELLPRSGTEAGAIRITRKSLTEGTPKERRTVRQKSQGQLHERAIASLPDDWDHGYHGEVLVLDHNQAKWAKRLGEHADLMLEWFAKNFDYFGEGEYARAPVIRVCEDAEEERALSRGVRSGSRGGTYFVSPGSEVITSKPDTGWIGYEVGWVNRTLLIMWLTERDPDLYYALPEWVGVGISGFVDGARRDGRKMEFRVDQWDKDGARLAVSQGRATPPREIMRFTREEFASGADGADAQTYWGRRSEASQLVRWLLSKESTRCKQAKGLLERYIKTLDEVVEEIKKKELESVGQTEAAETEEEEDERGKANAQRWRAREKEMMDETFERVFSDWTEKDWGKFEKAYFKYIS